jgi:hypothetical protein
MSTLQEHWLGVLRHLYTHAVHGAVIETHNFTAFNWQHGERGVCLLLPKPDGSLHACDQFLSAMPMPEKLIEMPGPVEGLRVKYVIEHDWVAGYALPVHRIPTCPIWREKLQPFASGFTLRQVETAEQAADFCFVQDQAYADLYSYPKGCASQFFTHPDALVGPNVVSAVIYDDASGLPVRCGSIIHTRAGWVSGVSGASCGTGRGAGCFRQLWSFLLEAARERFLAGHVLHETMPIAQHLAEKMELETVASFTRWSRCS